MILRYSEAATRRFDSLKACGLLNGHELEIVHCSSAPDSLLDKGVDVDRSQPSSSPVSGSYRRNLRDKNAAVRLIDRRPQPSN
jgi:hypothetical protein